MRMWSDTEGTIAVSLVVFATVGTLLSCSVELLVLHQLPGRLWRKLFTRQLVLLAISDIVMAMTSFYWVTSNAHIFVYNPAVGTLITRMVQVLCQWSGFTSVLLELHISLGLACSWARFECGLHLLDATVCFMPFLGAVGSALSSLLYPFTYIRDGESSLVMGKADPVEAVLGILAFLSCLLAIACALRSTRQSTPAAMQGVQNRLWMYPATFLISFGCRFAVDIKPELISTFVGVVYPSGVAANGLMNALIYFHQSRLSKKLCLNVQPQTDQDSERLGNIHSFHAIFDHNMVQVRSLGTTYTSTTLSSGQSLEI
mmetsp:Transcript_15258/g.41802  ORF Transcript_15258/g.41802 Transcript_15258/m.41802 type:complete len:315 (-) Transcript_15258:132-1076(-)